MDQKAPPSAGTIPQKAPPSSQIKKDLPPPVPSPGKKAIEKMVPKPKVVEKVLPGMEPVVTGRTVRNLKEWKEGEEAEVVLEGKNLHRITQATAPGLRVTVVTRSATEMKLKIKGRSLGTKGLTLRLTALGKTLEVPLGEEVRKARAAAAGTQSPLPGTGVGTRPETVVVVPPSLPEGVGGGTDSAGPRKEPVRPGIPLGPPELGAVAHRLGSTGTTTYVRRTFSWKEGAGAVEAVSLQNVRGLLTMRDEKHLRKLGGPYYDDRRGNLVVLGKLAKERGGEVSYSATLGPEGKRVIGFDLDNDGVVDAAIGDTMDNQLDRFWFLASPEAQWLLECMNRSKESDITAALAICAEGRSGGGSGGGRGVLTDPHGWLSKEPDCEAKPGEGIASSTGGEVLESILISAAGWRDIARRAREEGHTNYATAAEKVARTYDNLYDAYSGYVSSYYENGSDAEETQRAWREVQSANNTVEQQTRRAEDEAIAATGHSPANQPPRSPDGLRQGEIKDPRCIKDPNNLLSSGWLGKEFCQDLDMISCMRKLETVRGVTDGNCWTETGPDDKPTVKCKDNAWLRDCLAEGYSITECQARTGGGGGEGRPGSPGGPGSGPADRPVVPGRGGPSFSVADLQTMGGLLMTLCREGAEGFCRDGKPIGFGK